MKHKRKLPPHIVLPNGMWRFVKSGAKKAVSRHARPAKRVKHKGVVHMARRHRMSSKRGRHSLMGGIGGIAKPALIGVGAAHFASYLPVNMPYKEEAVAAIAGYLLGGKLKGAAVAGGTVLATRYLMGSGGASSSQNINPY